MTRWWHAGALGIALSCGLSERGPYAELAAPSAVVVQQRFLLDGRASHSTERPLDHYRWDFGDGTPALTTARATAIHWFDDVGEYEVQLDVFDVDGNATRAYATLTV